MELDRKCEEHRETFHHFAQTEIAPHAAEIDRTESFPEELVRKIAAQGYLAPWIASDHGLNLDFLTTGLLHEEIGYACSSARSLLTAHGMVVQAVKQWGTAEQKEILLPQLASGEKIAGFAITEPNAASSAPCREFRSAGWCRR